MNYIFSRFRSNYWAARRERLGRPVTLNINRLGAAALGMALLAITLSGYLALGGKRAAASAPQAPTAGKTGMRRYYMSEIVMTGAQADTDGCVSGFHMASLWEIRDTSNLEYDPTFALGWGDDGQGPPLNFDGWARTGWYEASGSDTPGVANCMNWGSSLGSDYGTVARLDLNNLGDYAELRWVLETRRCDSATFAWCIED